MTIKQIAFWANLEYFLRYDDDCVRLVENLSGLLPAQMEKTSHSWPVSANLFSKTGDFERHILIDVFHAETLKSVAVALEHVKAVYHP